MHKLGLGVATLLLSISPARAGVSHTVSIRSIAVSDFETVSEDGCFVTTGQLAAVHSNVEGTYALVAGQRVDYCAGDEPVVRAFLSGGPVTFTGTLIAARMKGTVELVPYSGPDSTPILLDVNLRFRGTGAVTTHTEYDTNTGDGFTASFTTTSERDATVSGSLTADGDAGTMTNAKLGTEVSGQLVLVP